MKSNIDEKALFYALFVTLALSQAYFYYKIDSGHYVSKNSNLESVIYPEDKTASFDTALYPNWKQANQQERFFSDRWEEVARIPDIDTCIYPHWEQADSLCFETYPGDLRYTDMWCEIASKRPIELGAQIILTNSHYPHNCNYNEK